MTPPENNKEPLLHGVRLRRARRQSSERRPTLLGQLAAVGSLGWLVVAPTLAGVFVGRWLDGKLGTGFQLTAALLLVGVALGFWLAWKRMRAE